jgi:integrase
MTKLNSFLAGQFHDYIEFRSSLGFSKKSLEERAATFDRFLFEQYPSHTRLSPEILFKWAETRQNEHPNGKRARLFTTETFLKYLCETNYCDLHIPPEAIPRGEHFNSYILSDRNLEDIFHAADTIPVHLLSPNREYVMPVMLRMMYCCALRPGEPFRLLRDDIDFTNGTIFIRQSKKHKDRTVWMSEELFTICKEYDDIFGDRPFFFTSPTKTMYTPSWLRSQFEICLKKSGPGRMISDTLRLQGLYSSGLEKVLARSRCFIVSRFTSVMRNLKIPCGICIHCQTTLSTVPR